MKSLKEEVGILADCAFVQLSLPKPDTGWYTQLLAARQVLFDYWITKPKLHSSTSTSILLLICNTIALLDIRILATRDGQGRKTAANLTNSMDFKLKQILNRPRCKIRDT